MDVGKTVTWVVPGPSLPTGTANNRSRTRHRGTLPGQRWGCRPLCPLGAKTDLHLAGLPLPRLMQPLGPRGPPVGRGAPRWTCSPRALELLLGASMPSGLASRGFQGQPWGWTPRKLILKQRKGPCNNQGWVIAPAPPGQRASLGYLEAAAPRDARAQDGTQAGERTLGRAKPVARLGQETGECVSLSQNHREP